MAKMPSEVTVDVSVGFKRIIKNVKFIAKCYSELAEKLEKYEKRKKKK